METAMVNLEIKLQRGSFRLNLACQLAAPWTVVFGPSGAGKSTLLRLIAGLERASKQDSVRIAIHGQYVTDSQIGLNLRPGSQANHRSTGMITQQSALFPHLNVGANIAYGLAHLRGLARLQRVNLALTLVGAAHLAARSPRDLSGGESQRVALARTLAPMPRLLLLDEPLSALDAEARDHVLMRLQSWLADEKIQTILVTHDAADALSSQAEVALLHEGKLTALGPASIVLASERDRLLARLASPKPFPTGPRDDTAW
jgi:ABC-type Fe3+/spermidine/putrescine transport system ATPase subunit